MTEKNRNLFIRIILSDEPFDNAETELDSAEEDLICNDLIGYADVLSEIFLKSAKTKSDFNALKHTLHAAKFMYDHSCYEEAIEYLADDLKDKNDPDRFLPLEELSESLDYDDGFCEFFLSILFEKLAKLNVELTFLKEDAYGEM